MVERREAEERAAAESAAAASQSTEAASERPGNSVSQETLPNQPVAATPGTVESGIIIVTFSYSSIRLYISAVQCVQYLLSMQYFVTYSITFFYVMVLTSVVLGEMPAIKCEKDGMRLSASNQPSCIPVSVLTANTAITTTTISSTPAPESTPIPAGNPAVPASSGEWYSSVDIRLFLVG